MRKLQILMVVICSTLLISAVYAQPAKNMADADDQFAFDLYSHLSSNSGNVFFSPYSLSSALSMTYEGSRGQTADEMRAVLHLPSDDAARRIEVSAFIHRMNKTSKTYELSTANALWAQKAFPFKEDYIKLVKDIYSGESRNLDFAADPDGSRKTINDWVLDNTKNRIKDLLPPGSIDASTRLVLTNAVYFKGKWFAPFPKESTQLDAFWISSAASVQTSMMGLTEKSFKYMENAQVQIVELPYQANDLSMVIILPRDKDIQNTEKSVSELLKHWDADMRIQAVDVYMPKFKFNAEYQMKGVLSDMGMKMAFDQRSADFSGMADLKQDRRLYIDQVYHKAWIDVNEEGTEAAAATGVVVAQSLAMVRSTPKIFRADHPFIFVIRENKTGHILFMGRVSDPRVS